MDILEGKLNDKKNISKKKELELEDALDIFKQITHQNQVEDEELEILKETENNIFGSLKESFEIQKKNIKTLKTNNILEAFKINKDNKSIDIIAKMLCLLFWLKSTNKIISSGKIVKSWVEIFLKKIKGDFENKFKELISSCFSKKLTKLVVKHILGNKNLQKKISAKFLCLRIVRTILMTKTAIEVKIQENIKFIKSLEKQESICKSFKIELKNNYDKLEILKKEHYILTKHINESVNNLTKIKEKIKLMKFKLNNSKIYNKNNKMKQIWDPRIVKPEIIFLDSLMTGIYFTLGYQLSNDPMLLNGIKNMISFNCDQFLLEEALNLLKNRPLIRLFCKTTRIEKLFWGNYIFGIETLSKFQRINQCKLKFFIIRDPFRMCYSLVKEVNFKKDIVIIQNLKDLCITELQNAITHGKLFLLVNIRLSGIF